MVAETPAANQRSVLEFVKGGASAAELNAILRTASEKLDEDRGFKLPDGMAPKSRTSLAAECLSSLGGTVPQNLLSKRAHFEPLGRKLTRDGRRGLLLSLFGSVGEEDQRTFAEKHEDALTELLGLGPRMPRVASYLDNADSDVLDAVLRGIGAQKAAETFNICAKYLCNADPGTKVALAASSIRGIGDDDEAMRKLSGGLGALVDQLFGARDGSNVVIRRGGCWLQMSDGLSSVLLAGLVTQRDEYLANLRSAQELNLRETMSKRARLDGARRDEARKLLEWETNPPPVRVEQHKQFARDNIREIEIEVRLIDERLEDVLGDLRVDLKKNYEELRQSIGALCGDRDGDELDRKYNEMVNESVQKIEEWYK